MLFCEDYNFIIYYLIKNVVDIVLVTAFVRFKYAYILNQLGHRE